MVIFLYGEDTFRSRERLKKLIERFKAERDPQGLNVVVLDAASSKVNILEEISASPFLAEKRMIVVERLMKTKNKELQLAIQEKITANKLPPTNVTIFFEEAAPEKHKEAKALWDTLKATPYAQEFAKLTSSEAGTWVKEYFKERGKTVDAHALPELVRIAGVDSWQAKNLFEVLTAYSGQNTAITEADVLLFLDGGTEDVIFALVDSIVAQKTKQAFEHLAMERSHGGEDGYVLAMLIRQTKILLELSDALKRDPGASSDSLARKIGAHPFVVKKSLGLIKQTPPEKFQELHRLLLEADIGVKTGKTDMASTLEYIIVRFGN